MSEFKDQRILITGGAGFIGSHLAESLLQDGRRAQVAVIDNFEPLYPREDKEYNLKQCYTSSNFQLFEEDIRNSQRMLEIFNEFKPDIVVHLAARAGMRQSLVDPYVYVDINIQGTVSLLEAARQMGVRNFVFASSSSVYGNSDAVPFKEDHPADRSLSPYGASKRAGELLMHSYYHVYGLSTACLRFFTVYGPRQRPDLAIHTFVKLALAKKEIPVFLGDGMSRRDYTNIKDILVGIRGAMKWVTQQNPRFGIFNLGSSNPIMLKDMLQMIEQAVGYPLNIIPKPLQACDARQTYADHSLAEKELGFKPQVNFRDGLQEFVDWMRQRYFS